MATGPAEPFASEETHLGVRARRSPGRPATWNGTCELDPAQLAVSPGSEPWRLRHLMYLVAVVAVLLWVGILVAGSLVLIALVILVCVVLLFAAVMGAGVILARRRSTRQDSLLWVLAIAAETRDAAGARGRGIRRSVPAADRTGGSWTWLPSFNWGTTLPEALERARKVVSRDAVLLAWVGQAAGKLPKALRMAATSRIDPACRSGRRSPRDSPISSCSCWSMQTISRFHPVFHHTQV